MNPAGNVLVSTYDHTAKTIDAGVSLHDALETGDDHDVPAILVRASDNKLMAFYCRHAANDSHYYMRISSNALDASAWAAEVDIAAQTGAVNPTYANAYQLTGETDSPIYLFWREYPDTAYSKSTDGGANWSAKKHIFANGEQRPYVQYAQNGTSRIDILMTEGHPNSLKTSIYHGYYQAGNLYKSDGTLVGAMDSGPYNPTSFTRIYDGSTNRAWNWDIAIDGSGNPVVTYAVVENTAAHSYRYAKWNGSTWVDNALVANAGTYIDGVTEPYYSGGCAIDPQDVNIVYCSIQTGAGNWNVWKYVTADGGANWTSTQVSYGVNKEIRPHVVSGHDGTQNLLFCKGAYASYTSFATMQIAMMTA